MTGVYLFATATGLPLVLWFLVSGDDDGGDAGADDAGLAGIAFRLLPLSTLAFVLATFGVCGLVLGAVDTGATTAFVAAAAAAAAGAFNSALFSYLRRSGSSSDVTDRQLAGTVGRVVLPVAAERRGRIAVTVGGQQVNLSARSMPGDAAELEVGAPVLVVEVEGGIARVTRLDPELG